MGFITQVDFTRQVRQRAGESHTLSGSTTILGNLDVYGSIMSGGTDLLDIFLGGTDTHVTAGTYNAGTTALDYTGTAGFTPFSVDVSALLDDTNTFVTGGTLNSDYGLQLFRNNGTTASTISLSALSDNVIVKYATSLSEMEDAFNEFNTAPATAGVVKLASNITLTGDITLDFGSGIELWGGGNSIDLGSGTQYKIIVNGSKATFRNIGFVGNRQLTSGAVNSQQCIEIDDGSMGTFKMIECRITDIIGTETGTYSTSATAPIHILDCANWSSFEFLFLGLGSQASGVDKPQGPLYVFWTSAGNSGTKFVFKDVHNTSPENNTQSTRFERYRNSLVVRIDGSTSTSVMNQVIFDETLTIDSASTWPSMDLYPNMYGSSVVVTNNHPTATPTYGVPGDVIVTGSTIYMKYGDIGSDTDWTPLALWNEGSDDDIYYNEGNVGIGTSNPAHPLHVSANTGNLEVKIENLGGNAYLTLESSATSNSFIDYEDVGGDRWIVGNHSNGTENFFKWSPTGSFAGVVMTLDRNGQLGLGDATPNARLHVVGLGATSATDALTVEDSGLNTLFHVRDDGYVGVGTDTPTRNIEISTADNSANGIIVNSDSNLSNTYSSISLNVDVAGTTRGGSVFYGSDAYAGNGGSFTDPDGYLANTLTITTGGNARGSVNVGTRDSGKPIRLFSGQGAGTGALDDGNLGMVISGTTSGNPVRVIMPNLPTSATGLPSGALWNNGGVINIV